MREAPDRIDELEKRLAALEGKRPGAVCRSCGSPSARLTRSDVDPTPAMALLGGKVETWTCDACGFAETKSV